MTIPLLTLATLTIFLSTTSSQSVEASSLASGFTATYHECGLANDSLGAPSPYCCLGVAPTYNSQCNTTQLGSGQADSICWEPDSTLSPFFVQMVSNAGPEAKFSFVFDQGVCTVRPTLGADVKSLRVS